MKNEELYKRIAELLENTRRQLLKKRTDVTKEQAYMRQHNFNMECQALAYKDEALGDADYMLFELIQNIRKLFEDE